MEAYIAGGWRAPARAEVCVGGIWRQITRAEAYVSGSWKTVLSFAPALTLSAPAEVYGSRNPSKPTGGNVTAIASAVPSGGVSPYRYQWSVIEGSVNIGSPNSATTQIASYLAGDMDSEGLLRIVCTDNLGKTAQADVRFYLSNQSSI